MTRRTQVHAAAIAVCFAIAVHSQLQVWDWFIEDAAISFAYARNFASGEGWVPLPGGERVEGFSNPTWTALLALFQAIGLTGFATAKPLALGFTAWSLLASYFLARRAMPSHTTGDLALVAPVVLATNTVYAVWSGSGLENALFGAILLTALWRLSVELDAEDNLRPWSAVWFFALALTRPEGLLYGAAAGVWVLANSRIRGLGVRPVLAWAAAILVPFAACIGLRLWYFAWPLPMTYYAKVGTGGTVIHHWDGRGWRQLREHAQILRQGWFLPLYLVGLLGLRARRARIGLVTLVAVALLLLWPGPEVVRALSFWPDLPAPEPYLMVRIAALLLVSAVLPLASIGGPGWTARAPAWSMAAVTLFFAAYANGDWMRGFRWMSLLAGPASVLFAAGCWELSRAVQSRWRHAALPVLISALLVGLTVPANRSFLAWFVEEGKNETPDLIRRRVAFTHGVLDRLFIDEPLRNLDMDMGAFMWWGNHQMVDVAGLVDVPIALHTFRDRPFVEEYLLQEMRPHIVHMHGSWDKTTDFTKLDAFTDNWVPLPPWRDGRRMHPGEFIRRDLVMAPSWTETADTKVNFAGGASLQGWQIPTEKIGAGRAFYLDTAWKTSPRDPGSDYRVFAFLSDGKQLASWELPMGYGWLSMADWRPDEVFRGQYSLELPKTLRPGRYDVGFAVFDTHGQALPAGGFSQEAYVAEGAVVYRENARFSQGEVRYVGAVEVVPRDQVDTLAASAFRRAMQAADQGACEQAELAWRMARLQVPKHVGWRDEYRPQIGRALSRCWTAQATSEGAARALQRAHYWDHREPSFLEAAATLSDQLYPKARAAETSGDFESAYWIYTEILGFQPTNAWARRRAEVCRNQRLGLGPLKMWGRLQRRQKAP